MLIGNDVTQQIVLAAAIFTRSVSEVARGLAFLVRLARMLRQETLEFRQRRLRRRGVGPAQRRGEPGPSSGYSSRQALGGLVLRHLQLIPDVQ